MSISLCSLAAWNAWRAERDEAPDLSQAALRALDLTGFDLSRADLRGADLRGTTLCDADLSALTWKVRTSSKRYSMARILPGLISMELNFSIVRSCWLRGTGNRPSAMRGLPAVRLFPIGCLHNNKYFRSLGPIVPTKPSGC